MTPEGRVKARVKETLAARGAYQFWPVQTGMGTRTVDCLACHRGIFLAIETKRPGKAKATPLQRLVLRQVHDAGGMALVIASTDMTQLERALDECERKGSEETPGAAAPA